MEAIDVHGVDYLVKPHSSERCEAVLERAKSQKVEKAPDAAALAATARPAGQFLERIVVKDGTKVTLVPTAKLDHVEALDDYLWLAPDGKKLFNQHTLHSVDTALYPDR